ncbi:alkylhydroperoxidase AhpD family core domain-containing protein [Dyadobacter koreensis]|uniref:Alkylhydroperoxidase AhpD family core domain-containing protein n=1 Tax=Dyadobacter koreensis TaxID=408657 RepID=A0A1H6UUH4_9BACT|nr:carboxymuconolactone decarboxylase family protein [Dyadobacter koreensis]SEI91970.1 alkylhydroperoxidase AhpD family core domain-containing protein [Dyadobacter koreensis]
MESRINVQAKGQSALKTIFGIGAYLKKSPIEKQLLELVNFRVSQINNCAYCLDMHAKELLELGETIQRIYSISAWEETPYYTTRERAAFAWAEAVTRCEVGDDVYKEAMAEFGEEELIDLTLAITTINTWNRFNLAFPTTPGTYRVGQFG